MLRSEAALSTVAKEYGLPADIVEIRARDWVKAAADGRCKPGRTFTKVLQGLAAKQDRAVSYGLTLREFLNARCWFGLTRSLQEEFGSEEAYLQHKGMEARAASERRALKRALELNPFTIPQAVATARTFGAAIDALPVGKDIRGRLQVHLTAHVATLEALIAPGGAQD